MKQFIVGFSMLALFVSAISAQAEITIGVNLSSTGPAAGLGIPQKNGVMLFGPDKIAGEKVRYVILDDATDPSIALQNFKRLTSEENIDVLIGPSLVAATLAIMSTAADTKTPIFTQAQSASLVTPMDDKRKWVFKMLPNDDAFNDAMVKHMIRKGVKTVSVIAVDDQYGEGNTKSFRKIAESKGIKILTVEKFKRNDTSATSQALRAMSGNPDAVHIIAAGTPAALPHLALVDRSYKGKIYQNGGAANADFLRLGKKALEGSYVVATPTLVANQLPENSPFKANAVKFAKAYEAKYGTLSTMAGHVWDTYKVIEAAIPKALKSGKPGTVQFREALRNEIEKTKGVVGAGAVYTLSPTDHAGISDHGVAVVRIENGAWKLDEIAAF